MTGQLIALAASVALEVYATALDAPGPIHFLVGLCAGANAIGVVVRHVLGGRR